MMGMAQRFLEDVDEKFIEVLENHPYLYLTYQLFLSFLQLMNSIFISFKFSFSSCRSKMKHIHLTVGGLEAKWSYILTGKFYCSSLWRAPRKVG